MATMDQLYKQYGAGRSRAQFNADTEAFFKGLQQAQQSTSNPNAVNQYLGRVRAMGASSNRGPR